MLVMRTLHYKDNLVSTLTATWGLYIYIIMCGTRNICVENYFLVPLRELFRVGSCKRC